MKIYHSPVLLEESVAGLAIKPEGIYVDVTFGGGGHAMAILKQLGADGRLFCFDQDPDAHHNKLEDSRCEFIAANFIHLKQYLKFYKVKMVDGILADFGVSSHQFDAINRGFSTRIDARLDMRMNPDQELNAHTIVNQYGEKELAQVFWGYGELRNAKQLARLIVGARQEKVLNTTFDLKVVLRRAIPERFENKLFAQVFQAIRIEVNNELDVIRQFLIQAASMLKSKGRLACISYHSLEDRLVKRFFQSGNFEGETEKDFYGNPTSSLRKIGKLIVPDAAEIQENNRARSAKLRIAEKV